MVARLDVLRRRLKLDLSERVVGERRAAPARRPRPASGKSDHTDTTVTPTMTAPDIQGDA